MIDNRIYFYVMNESKWQADTHFVSECVNKKLNRNSARKVNDDAEEEEEEERKAKHEWMKARVKTARKSQAKTFMMGQKVYHFITQCGTIDTHYSHTRFEYQHTRLLLYGRLFICALYGSFIWP